MASSNIPPLRRCCVPSLANLNVAQASERSAEERPRVTKGSLEGMVPIEGGIFLMGSESANSVPADGEGPVRRVMLDPFYVSRHAITNEQFADFVRASGYKTEAEILGWSFVFWKHVPEGVNATPMPGLRWWQAVNGAYWKAPEGPDSSVLDRPHHPAVHISWNDAQAYCSWMGVRLLREAEWECSARGGLEQLDFPWGNDLIAGGRHHCNIWQGEFPDVDLGEDGFTNAAPVDSFEPNAFGLFNMAGNVWEWCEDIFDPIWHVSATRWNPTGPLSGSTRVQRGGSFLCHQSYCFRYRNSARTGNAPDSSASNLGFRVARD